jgi:hypothetical protein
MKIEIIQEKRGEIERIQKKFEKELSPRVIKQKTAAAMNKTMDKTASPKAKQLTIDKYNLRKKHLRNVSIVSPKAYAGDLKSGLKISALPNSMIDFAPKWKRNKTSLSVQIMKGKTVVIRSAFIATMKSGHKGVFARGFYPGKRRGFVFGNEQSKQGIGRRRDDFGNIVGGDSTGNTRITELRGPSPFSVATNKGIGDKVHEAMGTEVLKRVEGILLDAVNKIKS